MSINIGGSEYDLKRKVLNFGVRSKKRRQPCLTLS